jgi:hypothetical protein
MGHIEVYKQTQRFTTEFEVRKELSLMYGGDGLDRLDFDNNQPFHQKINAVAEFQFYFAIDDRKAYLVAEPIPVEASSYCKQAVYVLSKSPGPNSEWTFIAAVITAWLICWALRDWTEMVAIGTSGLRGIGRSG